MCIIHDMAPSLRSCRMRIGLAGAFAVAGLAACDSDPPLPSLATCSSGWTAVTPMNDNLFAMPRAMVWQDGVVYQASAQGLVAVPVDGGEVIDVVSDRPVTGVWVEGDNVIYSLDDQLYAVPRAGGDSTLLFDGGRQNDPSSGSSGQDHIGQRQYLDSNAFYWTTTAYPYATDGSHVWRVLRTGGAVEGFALLPIETVDALSVRSDGVLAVGQSTTVGGPFYSAFLAPFAHGAAREVPLSPTPDTIISADNEALLWSVYTGNRQGSRETHEVWISPADGSPAKRLSRNLPGELQATWSIPNEQGGHVIGGVEPFDDGVNHASVFHVSRDGNATRLACDASNNWPVYTATALAPDATYLSVRYDQPGWMLVRLPPPGEWE